MSIDRICVCMQCIIDYHCRRIQMQVAKLTNDLKNLYNYINKIRRLLNSK